MVKFQLVVPAYNEEKNIALIVDGFIKAARFYSMTPKECQLVLVNNGSTDQSSIQFRYLQQDPIRSEWIQIVEIEQNQGYGHGVFSGLISTTAEYIAWSHADMQCDPNDAFKALQILLAKPEGENWMVKGVRYARNPKDVFVSRCFEFFAHICLGFKFYEINAQPKVFHRRLLEILKSPPKDFSFDLYVLYTALSANYSIDTIAVNFPPRIHGTSKWASHFLSRYKTIFKMIKYIWHLRGGISKT